MTNEEIIKWLESLKRQVGQSHHRDLWDYEEAIDLAIEALQYKHTVHCSGCRNFDTEQMSAVCHDCARAYRDRYEG